MPSKTATKTPDDDSERCPNCGYCPHCGQSAKPQVIPQPYPVPYRVYPQPWTEREIGVPYRVWSGTGIGMTTKGIWPEHIAINPHSGNEC